MVVLLLGLIGLALGAIAARWLALLVPAAFAILVLIASPIVVPESSGSLAPFVIMCALAATFGVAVGMLLRKYRHG